jgi:hypothetical protein
LFMALPHSVAVREISAPSGDAFTNITAVYGGSWSDLWISQQDGRLMRYFGNAWATYAQADSPISLISEDADGNLYLIPGISASAETTYLLIAPGARLQAQGQPEQFHLAPYKGGIQTIAFDAAGGTWMGIRDGAVRIRGNGEGPWNSSASKKTGPRPNLSAGTRAISFQTANSVPSFPGGKFSLYSAARGMVGNQVRSITGDGSGNIYFTTGYKNVAFSGGDVAGAGISRWNHRIFASLTTANGLASNTVHASLFDPGTGLVWFGTDQVRMPEVWLIGSTA